MQLGKKSKNTDMFERVRGDLGEEAEESAPLVSSAHTPVVEKPVSARVSSTLDREAIHITVAETISAKLSREGALKSFEVKGDLQLRITDPSFTKVKLDLVANPTSGAQFRTHPNVDKNLFTSSKAIQLKDSTKRFPANNSIGVLRWRATASSEQSDVLPITFTVWVNKGADESSTITIEYELTGNDTLRDVVVTIPYSTSEPAVSSFDAVYEVTGDSLDWTIGTVDEENQNGAFEFEAQAEDESEFFPMSVRFSKTKPFVDVDVSIRYYLMIRPYAYRIPGIFYYATRDGGRGFILKGHQVGCRILHHRMKNFERNTKGRHAMTRGKSPAFVAY
jgi:coatomer subunit delta